MSFCLFLILKKPTLIAFSMWVSSPSTWTATYWPVKRGITKCTLATRTVHNAWVKALIFYASSIVRTVNVMLTFTSLD